MTTSASKDRTATDVDPLDFVADGRRFYFDPRLNATMVSVFQGDFYATANPNEIITTVLGSCIAVCARDPSIRFGGMNHFLLPHATGASGGLPGHELRYGSYSIERLINVIMSHGGRRDQLEIKIFGGATLTTRLPQVGGRNADFVEGYLRKEGLKVAASDLRGHLPRRLRYFPATGKALVSTVADARSSAIFEQEAGHQDSPHLMHRHASTEFFGSVPPRRRNDGARGVIGLQRPGADLQDVKDSLTSENHRPSRGRG